MSRLIPSYDTKLFIEVYEDVDTFTNDFEDSGLYHSCPGGVLTTQAVEYTYYLLRARYGNNPIANLSEDQFKDKVHSIMCQYGPSWEKRLEIQRQVRELTPEEILVGGKAIYNHAYHSGEEPATLSLDELQAINEQNTTNYKKSQMDAFAQQWDLIDIDVTNEYINKFKICFKTVVSPERIFIYESEDDDE